MKRSAAEIMSEPKRAKCSPVRLATVFVAQPVKVSSRMLSPLAVPSPQMPDDKRTPPSEPTLFLELPQLAKMAPSNPTEEKVGDIFEEMQSAEWEIECIAEELRDEHGGYVLKDGLSVWKQKDGITEEEKKEFKENLAVLHGAEKKRNNLLDMIKHGVMKWVDGNEQTWVKTRDTSDFYYVVYEGYEFQKKGWFQFSAPLTEGHQAHFEEYLQQYLYYGYPIYQDPRYYESTDGDLCFELGDLTLYTADGMMRESLSIIENGDKRDIKSQISLYEEDAESYKSLKSLKKKLREIIKKYHVL